MLFEIRERQYTTSKSNADGMLACWITLPWPTGICMWPKILSIIVTTELSWCQLCCQFYFLYLLPLKTQGLSWCQLCHHWQHHLHQWLLLRQPLVLPAMIKLVSWQLTGFSRKKLAFFSVNYDCNTSWWLCCPRQHQRFPDSKVHGANMGPTWVLSAPDGPHIGPMNLAIRDW